MPCAGAKWPDSFLVSHLAHKCEPPRCCQLEWPDDDCIDSVDSIDFECCVVGVMGKGPGV